MLDRVAECVAVVQDLPQPLLGEVLADDAGLHGDRKLDRAPELRGRRVGRGIHVGLDDVEDLGLGDEAGLHDLGVSGQDLVLRQGVEGVEVAQHGTRRVERADEVLALGGVDAVFPPTDASTMPSTVVGICTTSMPRSQVAATKPARSVVAPPPRPMTASVRVKSVCPMICQQNAATSTRLALSASGISARSTWYFSGKLCAQRLGPGAERRRVDDEHFRDLRTEVRRDIAEQSAADEHRVAGRPGDGDLRGRSQAGVRAHSATSSAIAS